MIYLAITTEWPCRRYARPTSLSDVSQLHLRFGYWTQILTTASRCGRTAIEARITKWARRPVCRFRSTTDANAETRLRWTRTDTGTRGNSWQIGRQQSNSHDALANLRRACVRRVSHVKRRREWGDKVPVPRERITMRPRTNENVSTRTLRV